VPEVFLTNLQKLRPGGSRLNHADLEAVSYFGEVRAAHPTRKRGATGEIQEMPIPSGDLLGPAAPRATSCPGDPNIFAVPFILYFAMFSGGLRAETALAPPASPAPTLVHITDAQDRMGTGELTPTAEARSRANALYAEAMLLPQDLAADQQAAVGLYRQIVALDPSFAEAQIKLANLFLQSGQTDEALSQLQAATVAHPDSIPIEVALGYTQRMRGQNDEAVRLCTDALTRDPSQTAAMRVLLEVARDGNDLAGGVLHIEDILKARASSVTGAIWLNFARLYLEIARSEPFPPSGETLLQTRLPILQEAAAIPPPDVETLTLLSDNYRDLGRKIEALSTLQRVVALDPSNTDVVLQCAGLESDLGEVDDALKDYEKAYALNPSLPGLRDLLGGLYLDRGHFDDATRIFEAALADSPQNPIDLIDLGIADEGAHHPDKAQTCFRQVFESVACPPEAYLKLAAFQLEHQDLKGAGATLAGPLPVVGASPFLSGNPVSVRKKLSRRAGQPRGSTDARDGGRCRGARSRLLSRERADPEPRG
jgi:tetratricopeptide (TPR) repeat protein